MALARSSHIVALSERITQVHTLYPSLGVRKWSIDKSVRSLVSPDKETFFVIKAVNSSKTLLLTVFL